jgi:hypothetical protein
MSPTTVRVDLGVRGAWEVALSDGGDPVTCTTIEEASRVAHRYAADRRPCELIVCDAYHRVVQRELIKSAERGRRITSRRRTGLLSARSGARTGGA